MSGFGADEPLLVGLTGKAPIIAFVCRYTSGSGARWRFPERPRLGRASGKNASKLLLKRSEGRATRSRPSSVGPIDFSSNSSV